jgi:hypothetical protein
MNTLRHYWLKPTAVLMVMMMTMIGVGPRAIGGMVSSTLPPGQIVDRVNDLQTVRTALEQKEVQARLLALGYTPNEVASRLDRLSDAELHQLALHADQAQVAGWHGFVLAVFVIALIAVLVYWLIHHADGHSHPHL